MRILIAGDFCPKDRVADLIQSDKGQDIFSEWKDILKNVDYSIINFECPIIENDAKPIEKIGPALNCTPKAAKLLKDINFKMVTLANNHFFDYGQNGVETTIKYLTKYNIDYVGGGQNQEEARKILYKEIGNHKFAFINICENEFSIANEFHGGSNPIDLINNYRDIQEAKKHADFVIIIIHGGHEGYQLPNPTMQKTYRFFAESGASAIINHHQHCYSGYEVYNGVPIFYGLGNFCFDWENLHNNIWNEGYAVELNFNKNGIDFKLIPYIQCNETPNVIIEKNRDKFDKKINELNQIISDKELLNTKFDEYVAQNIDGIKVHFLPNNRYLKGLIGRKFIPNILSTKAYRTIMNKFSCQSHRELFLRGLEIITQKKS